MFVWRWNKVDRKFWRENENKIFFGVCLVGWRGRKINSGVQVFSLRTHQKVFSLKWRENWKDKMRLFNGRKCLYALAHCLCQFFIFIFIFFFSFPGMLPLPFFFLFLSWACCLFQIFIFYFSFFVPRCCLLPYSSSSSSSFFFFFWAMGMIFVLFFCFLFFF